MIYWKDGKIIWVGGKIAMALACCCAPPDPNPNPNSPTCIGAPSTFTVVVYVASVCWSAYSYPSSYTFTISNGTPGSDSGTWTGSSAAGKSRAGCILVCNSGVSPYWTVSANVNGLSGLCHGGAEGAGEWDGDHEFFTGGGLMYNGFTQDGGFSFTVSL